MKGSKLLALVATLGLSGCSLQRVALRSTVSLLDHGAGALYEETDPQFARETLGPQLKLVESLLETDRDNLRMLRLLAEGFGGLAFLFHEDTEPERAKGFYLRGRDYALRALARKAPFRGLADLPVDRLEGALQNARLEDVPELYWAGFGWAGFINLSKDSAAALAELPKAVALMKRARELDPGYQFAGAELFFGLYYASRPAMLGGDLNKARAHFQEARRRTGGRYLMAYVLEARHLAVGAQDRELFDGLIAKVLETQAGALPRARLIDAAAKLKAAALKEKADDYF